jgi:hypothetical protein
MQIVQGDCSKFLKLYQDTLNGDLFVLGKKSAGTSYRAKGVKYSTNLEVQFSRVSIKLLSTCIDIYGKGNDFFIVYKNSGYWIESIGIYLDVWSQDTQIQTSTLVKSLDDCQGLGGSMTATNQAMIGFIPKSKNDCTFIFGTINDPGCSSVNYYGILGCNAKPNFHFIRYSRVNSASSFTQVSLIAFESENTGYWTFTSYLELWKSVVRPVSYLHVGNGEVILHLVMSSMVK